jgi:hypothetical protein
VGITAPRSRPASGNQPQTNGAMCDCLFDRMAMERIEESDRVRAFVCRTQPEAPMTTGPW